MTWLVYNLLFIISQVKSDPYATLPRTRSRHRPRLNMHWPFHYIVIQNLLSWSISSNNWAVTCDFQQCGILTWIDSVEPLQPPIKLRNSKWCSVSSLQSKNTQATSKGSDQTAHMHRLIWGFAGHTYHFVGNLMHWLSYGKPISAVTTAADDNFCNTFLNFQKK